MMILFPSTTTVAGKLSIGLFAIASPPCVNSPIFPKLSFKPSILIFPSVPILPTTANFTCSSAFACFVFPLASLALVKIPL